MTDTLTPVHHPEHNPEEQGGIWSTLKSSGKQLLFFYLMSSVIKSFVGKPTNNNDGSVVVRAASSSSRNLFPTGQLFDLYVYLDESAATFNMFSSKEKLFWKQEYLKYEDWSSGPTNDGVYRLCQDIPATETLRNNQSMFLHVFVCKSGSSPDPENKNYVASEIIYSVKQLNRYRKKFYKKTSNLLTGASEQSQEELQKADIMPYEVLSYWHPNITINIVNDQTEWTKGSIPPPLDQAVHFDPSGRHYYPVIMLNSYWNLMSDYRLLNKTDQSLELCVTYQPISMFKYQLYASQQVRSNWSSFLGAYQNDASEDDQDTIKQAFLETNPYLLGITVIVSVLHTVFEFLAFKNDVQFWNSRKDLAGLSVRTVLFNIFQTLIVFLYICDNETNFVVKCSVGVGLLIECWKIPKVLNVEIDYNNKAFGLIPHLKFTDKGSYVDSETKLYDEIAYMYLSWLLFPLLGGYAIYSVLYLEHRGWYSFVLSIMYGFLLTFGFITMTPQLFINYKLKSVAHLPWRMLTYKFINTFIDDLFAFVIRMPTLYRIGCFRDDIIFLIYLYQRWIYRVDPSRFNEYGTSLKRDEPSGTSTNIDSVSKKND